MITLRLLSDTPQAQIAVRLNHVHPDGASTRITYGVLNLSHRDNPAQPTPLNPGTETHVSLQLDHIAYRVPAGHQIRVAISSAYWPLVWPSPESGTLALTSGTLNLPVRATATGDEWTFPPPAAETALAEPTAERRPGRRGPPGRSLNADRNPTNAAFQGASRATPISLI